MGKQLKLFNEHSQYETFINGEDVIRPNVSFCLTENEVHFNPDRITYSTIDLGLPSGTLWANKNIDAKSESDKGVYFQWASTIPVDEERYQQIMEIIESGGPESQSEIEYVTETSPYINTSGITKYNDEDGKVLLEDGDDAAYVHMGSEWHVPSIEQINELSACTTPTLETVNDVEGIRLTSVINGNSIFIPFTYSDVSDNNEYSFAYIMINRIIDGGKNVFFNYALEAYKDIFGEETNIGIHMANRVVRFNPCSVRGVIIPITPAAENLYNLIHPYEPLTNPTSFTITIDAASKGYIDNWYSANRIDGDPSMVNYTNCVLYTTDSGTIYISCSTRLDYWEFKINSNYEIESYDYDNYSDIK